MRHLETSTAAMADDLIEKARIIEHYVMESRTGWYHEIDYLSQTGYMANMAFQIPSASANAYENTNSFFIQPIRD